MNNVTEPKIQAPTSPRRKALSLRSRQLRRIAEDMPREDPLRAEIEADSRKLALEAER